MTITTTTIDNGVNVEALLGARDAITDTPRSASSPGGRPTPG